MVQQSPIAATSRPRFRGPSVWTSADQLLIKIATVFLVMGAMSHVLPALGLQFRKLAHLGNAAPVAGTVMLVLGAFIVLYVTLLKGRMLWVLVGGACLGVVGIATIALVGWYESTRWKRATPPASPSAVAPPVPTFTPPAHVGNRGTIEQTQSEFVTRFGASRVARIEVSGTSGIDLGASVRKLLDALPAQERPGSWRTTHSGDTGMIIVAPVDSLDAVRTLLPLGDYESTRTPGTLKLKLDRAKCVATKVPGG
jgi:hypothetical protein